MATIYEIHRALRATPDGGGQDDEALLGRGRIAGWCALLQGLVLEGGAITLEMEARMSADGLDLERLRRSLGSARRPGPVAAGGRGLPAAASAA